MTNSLLPITIIPVQMFQYLDERIRISHSLINYWEIDTKKPIRITVGGKHVITHVEAASITKNEMYVDKELFQDLSLPIQEGQWIVSYSHQEHSLHIGPIIGLLTNVSMTENGPNFHSIHSFCEELHELITEIGGLFYVFQLNDFSDRKIEGYYLKDEQWEKRTVPYPDVIYNRIHSRKFEASPAFQSFKTTLLSKRIAMFNDQFLSKDYVHDLLFKEDYMHPYLPETKMLTAQTLDAMLKKYNSVFIKPINGSQGRNIMKLSKVEERVHVIRSTGGGRDYSQSYHLDQQLYSKLTPSLRGKIYLIQQAIPLLEYKNRQLDFRVLCHKNLANMWKATSAVARISADKQFVSNIARGGELMKPIKLLTQISDRETAIQQLILMKELAMETAMLVSRNVDGFFGELGIDIGMDHDGKLWIIEVNSKPSKSFEEDARKIRPSAKALLEYCTFLSFSWRREQ
ncbi:glutathione synthase/RimK-type ligase-like ATP-grasp enzyme [Cytobacillus eiseniae]|uniref:Glutathione synthase/RimK-type ligase-like ATP-grasp enzyme n=1 Tax=Cytobacillus eiseniae TaxID=762947 RepID=A0ABS4RDS1_9BACI|nr:YheC/YheD family protein [Cytobacillus eiseniae]MBP2241053.1 glutathione synthase/RimK-type ligase-like ATP-grasp enzyme [Cytobacillus eiseniae]